MAPSSGSELPASPRATRLSSLRTFQPDAAAPAARGACVVVSSTAPLVECRWNRPETF